MKRPFSKLLTIAVLGYGCLITSLYAAPRPLMDVPQVGVAQGQNLVQNIQVSDPRVLQLEEQVRQLTGRIEELNFIMLELQEQLRRTQEDNEFRFQQLEEKDQSNAAPAIKPVPKTSDLAAAPEEIPLDDVDASQSLGSIEFDANGDAIGAALNKGLGQGVTGFADYDSAYSAFISGDFVEAETGFRRFIDENGNDALVPNAHYWLGESVLAQGRYNDAAEVFLEANRQFPDGEKAPEALIKLGVALTGLDKRDIACAVFDQFGARYPNASANLKTNLDRQRQRAACS